MTVFNNQMRSLEEQKLASINRYSVYNQEELAMIGKTLEEQKQKSVEDGLKYRKALEETIEELDRERAEIIKKKNDETAQILNKIKQEYEFEAESINQKIREFNEKKKEYDFNIKKIDEEQTAYVAKARAEAEQELGKLTKMLSDEIEDLKNKIESYKVQREQKMKEIFELNTQLNELINKRKEEERILSINRIILWSSLITIIILSYIVYTYYYKEE